MIKLIDPASSTKTMSPTMAGDRQGGDRRLTWQPWIFSRSFLYKFAENNDRNSRRSPELSQMENGKVRAKTIESANAKR